MNETPRSIDEFQEIIEGRTGLQFDAVQLGAVALILESESTKLFKEENNPYWAEDLTVMISKANQKSAELGQTPDYQLSHAPEDELSLAA